MNKWIQYDDDWFNLDDFCHIWIETRNGGSYLMGEWRHNQEEVILSKDWDSLDDLKIFFNTKLGI